MTDKKPSNSDPFSSNANEQTDADRTTATISLKAKEIKSEDVVNPDKTEQQDEAKPADNIDNKETPNSAEDQLHSKTSTINQTAEPTKIMEWAGYLAAGLIGGIIALLLSFLINPSTPNSTVTTSVEESFSDQLAKLESNLETLAKTTQSSTNSATRDFTELAEELTTTYDQKLENLRQQLTAKIEQIPPKMAEASSENQLQMNENIEKLLSQVTKLQSAVETINQKNLQRDQTISTLSLGMTQLDDQEKHKQLINNALKPVASHVTQLEQKLAGLTQDSEVKRKTDQRTALMIALTNLKRTIDRGERYDGELDTIKRLSAIGLPLKDLERYSETGVPPFSELERTFPKILRSSLEAETAKTGDTFLQKLAANASSLVRIRRTGEVSGNTAEAILARMEVDIQNGDFSDALTEGKALTGKALTKAQPWLEQLAGRLSVEQAIQNIEIKLLSDLGTSRSQSQQQNSVQQAPSQ